MQADVVVVGAGAAGIMAAWRAATLGAKVILIEKTARLGTKILVSGGGKCNICHDGPIENVLKAFRPNEARFIRPSVYRFPATQIVPIFTERGLEVYTRPDGRIFPVSKTAKDVVGILRDVLEDAGVEIYYESPVERILVGDGRVQGLVIGEAKREGKLIAKSNYGAKALLATALEMSDDGFALKPGEIKCSKLVVAVGGSSYPNSGTTGDGWKWMREVGHTVNRTHAALAPIYLKEPKTDLAGVALRDIVLKARKGKEFTRWKGDLLFTHQGVSGPCALGISREVEEAMDGSPIELIVDFAPSLTDEQLTDIILKAPQKTSLQKFLDEHLTANPFGSVAEAMSLTLGMPLASLDRKARNRLVQTLKGWVIGEVKSVPLEKGEVVAGGVELSEVDPKTMASLKIEGLYLCGEILDIAGPVGGYNLQAAFATGFVAGESAATTLH